MNRNPQGRRWSFLRRPFWVFSHFFALGVVLLFVVLGLWQLDRLEQRRVTNAEIGDRSAEAAVSVADLLDDNPEAVQYRPVADQGVVVDSDVARIGNQTGANTAGDHVVALVELDDGNHVFVNRGFVPLTNEADVRSVDGARVIIEGWLRASQQKDGIFGPPDGLQSQRIPRFHVPTLADRVDTDVVAVWVQLETRLEPSNVTEQVGVPEPVPLPSLDEGNHLSYAVQWFIFACLGAVFYVALLHRTARSAVRP